MDRVSPKRTTCVQLKNQSCATGAAGDTLESAARLGGGRAMMRNATTSAMRSAGLDLKLYIFTPLVSG
jgi:hypothetical protein